MLLRQGGAHLAAERSPSVARADGARLSVAVPNGEGVASGSATQSAKNLKKAGSYAKAPAHEKHFAPLDVRGLWHARPLPTASALDKSRPAAAQQKNYIDK